LRGQPKPLQAGWTRPNPRIAGATGCRDASIVAEPVIERGEVVALLFNLSDIVAALTRIERLLGDDDGEEEADGG
jgi:hypothetical protein